MVEMMVLNEADLRKLVPLDLAAIDCVEDAFRALATGMVVMPPILSLEIQDRNGEVDVKTAYVPGLDSFAIKVSPGFFDNPKLGLPSTSGLMILFSSRTGMVEALLLDNGYLTDVRTAAAGAVAARHLSNPDASRAAIVGAGTQARLQLQALSLVRPIRSAVFWARDIDKAKAAAEEMADRLGIEVAAEADRRTAVTGADIVVTTTPSTEPLVEADWLRPGQHVTAMGSDQSYKNELAPECLARCSLYVADRRSQTESLGELHHAIRKGAISQASVITELGDIVTGNRPGRSGPDALTICDLTGTGVQDTAIATFARQRAIETRTGTRLDN